MATNAGDTSFTSGSDPSQICNACGEPIVSSSLLQKISCGHIFHKACLEVCIKTRPFCPICNARIITEPQAPAPTVSQVRTRSRSRTTANATTSNNDTTIQTATNTTRAAEILRSCLLIKFKSWLQVLCLLNCHPSVLR